MKRYDFMKYKQLKKFEIEDIRKTYGIDFHKIPEGIEMKCAEKYLKKKIEHSNWKEELVPEKFMTGISEKDEKERLENMLMELRKILENESNYVADVSSMVTMAAAYGFSERVSPTDEMKTVWESDSNKNKENGTSNGETYKIDKAVVRKYYPIEGVIFSKNEDAEVYLKDIHKAYMNFHTLMISKSKIGIFDIETPIQDYTRYSVMRSHKIYETLKDFSIENRVLMEYALGIGYANQAYFYMKEITTPELVKEYLCIVKKGAEIPAFFIRKKIMKIIWQYLDISNNKKNRIQSAEKVLSIVQKILKDIFEDTLEYFWNVFCYFLDAERFYKIEIISETDNKMGMTDGTIYQIRLKVNTKWENYLLEHAYKDFIKAEGMSDWDSVKSVEDCFKYIENFRYSSEEQIKKNVLVIHGRDVKGFDIVDCTGHRECLLVEQEKNDMGKKILDEVKKQIRNKKLPKEDLDIYKMYYKEREEAYKRISEEEQKKLYGKDIKIRDTMKKVTPFHTYAILQREIIKVLVTEI